MYALEKKIPFEGIRVLHLVSRYVGLIKETSGKNLIFPREITVPMVMHDNLIGRNVCFLQNARETGCTSSRATIVLEILSRGKVKGNRGLVVRGATLHRRRTARLPHNFGNQRSRLSELVNTWRDIARRKRNRKGQGFLVDDATSVSKSDGVEPLWSINSRNISI